MSVWFWQKMMRGTDGILSLAQGIVHWKPPATATNAASLLARHSANKIGYQHFGPPCGAGYGPRVISAQAVRVKVLCIAGRKHCRRETRTATAQTTAWSRFGML